LARLGSGAARQQFTGILDPDLFGCSCELKLTADPLASTGGCLGRKPQSAKATWAKAKFGQAEHKSDILQDSSSNVLFGSCELVVLLSCEFLVLLL
jgi:hypothetical protein